MSKYERFIIYPLLLIALVYGLIGNPIITAKELVIKNDDGVEVVRITSSKEGGGVALFNKYGVIETFMASGRGGMISISDKYGENTAYYGPKK